MEDKIEHLAHELRKRHNINKIDDHIKVLLVENGIITKPSHVHLEIENPNKPAFIEVVATVAAKHNIFHENIIIMIKPDHSDRRCLRVVIQVGKKVFNYLGDKDDLKKKDRKVFNKELRFIEKNIRVIMQRLKKAA